MESMKSNRILIWVLAISNLSLLVFLVFQRPNQPFSENGPPPFPPPPHQAGHAHKGPLMQDPKMVSFMRDSLGFTDEEFKAFRGLRRTMEQDGQKHHVAIRKAKYDLFSLGLDATLDVETKDSLLTIICTEFKALDELTMEHFHSLSLLGTTANQVMLNEFLQKLISHMGPPHKGPPAPEHPEFIER
jgi:hypothetical protein